MKEGILCVVYVDDTIFAGADEAVLEEEIRALGVSDTEQQHKFQLRNEGEVGAFLGIQITKLESELFRSFKLDLWRRCSRLLTCQTVMDYQRQREILRLAVTQMAHHSLKRGNIGL